MNAIKWWAAGCALVMVLGAQSAQAKGLAGSWECRGWNPGNAHEGKPDYKGTLEITEKGPQTYEVDWNIGGKAYHGIALHDPRAGVVGTICLTQGVPTICIYRPSEDGNWLEGIWLTKKNLKARGYEDWRRADGSPAGVERAAAGTDFKGKVVGSWECRGWNPGAKRKGKPSYRGAITVNKITAQTFEVEWTVAGSTAKGIMVKDPRAKVFASGCYVDGKATICLYRPSQDGAYLEGKWAVNKSLDTPGYEDWRRGGEGQGKRRKKRRR